MSQMVWNAAKALGIVACVLLVIAALLAPPRFVAMDISNAAGNSPEGLRVNAHHLGFGGNPMSIGDTYFFIVAGAADVYVSGERYETVELDVGRTLEVMRGRASHRQIGGFVYLIHVDLETKIPGLRMMRYTGFLTAGGKDAPEVLAIHPKYRGQHNPLDWLTRQYTNRTGKNPESLNYVTLEAESDDRGQISTVSLDFSHANGGATEYLPPPGWPPANLHRRVLYSMDRNDPAVNYQSQLAIHQTQAESPYDMGDTFFYCVIDGHYCAGRASTFFDRGRDQQQASIEIWINEEKNNPVLRYRP